jgi:hypothetical protein
VETCSAAPFQFLDLDIPVAAVVTAVMASVVECVAVVAVIVVEDKERAVVVVVAAMREYAECVVVVAVIVVAEDKERAVAAMRKYAECVAAVAVIVVAEDKEMAVAATLGEDIQVAVHCVTSVVVPAGGIDSVVDAGEAATRDGGGVCDRAFDLSVHFLYCHLYSAPSKDIPQQRSRVRRGEPL